MPLDFVGQLTMGELAVMNVIANETDLGTGPCDLTIAAIVERACTGRGTVQSTLRFAESQGWISVEMRHRKGQHQFPNRILIISPEWREWLQNAPTSNPIDYTW